LANSISSPGLTAKKRIWFITRVVEIIVKQILPRCFKSIFLREFLIFFFNLVDYHNVIGVPLKIIDIKKLISMIFISLTNFRYF
jgi:hypothetical protein